MALQTLGSGGVWIGAATLQDTLGIGSATFVIDASGEQASMIIRCPKAGTLDRFSFNIGAVGNSPDNGLRASFQSVDATTGLPSGTILGATNNAFVTYAHTVTTGWKNTNFGETVTVTRGQLIALVVDIPSFTASDSVTITRCVTGLGQSFPYAITATSTKDVSGQYPVMALHYTDGYVQVVPGHVPATSLAQFAYNVTTGTADEYGLAFSVPFPATLNAVSMTMQLTASADAEIVLYGADGTTVLDTISLDADINTAQRAFSTFFLSGAVNLSANTTYRITLRPTTSNNVQLNYYVLPTADVLPAVVSSNWYATSQLNQGGTWTNYNSGNIYVPMIALNLSALDDGAGGGVKIAQAMTGGFVG